jgi:hypothetical protein
LGGAEFKSAVVKRLSHRKRGRKRERGKVEEGELYMNYNTH